MYCLLVFIRIFSTKIILHFSVHTNEYRMRCVCLVSGIRIGISINLACILFSQLFTEVIQVISMNYGYGICRLANRRAKCCEKVRHEYKIIDAVEGDKKSFEYYRKRTRAHTHTHSYLCRAIFPITWSGL